MATDSIMGLFQDPQQYQQQALQQQMKQNYEIARLTPEQQVTGGLRTAGYQLGGAVGGLMGAEDPQMKLQSLRKQVLQRMDQNDPKSLIQAAQALQQAGDVQGANALFKASQEAAVRSADIGLKLAQTKKAENFQMAQADAEKKRNIISDVEDRLSRDEKVDPVEINKAKLAFGDISRPKTFQQADGTIVTVPPTVDASMFPNIGKYMTGGGGSATGGKAGVITTPLSEEKAAQTEEARRGRLSSLEAGSAQLQTTLDTITQTKGLIGNKTTGYGAFLAGLPTSDAMTLSDNTEQIKASVALTKLKEMKQESKTGASGLGALNMKELEVIQSILGRLNPKSANYATDLKKVEEFFVRAQKAMNEEVKLTRNKQQTITNSPDVAPKQSPMAGKNPQLQPSSGKLTFAQKVQQTMADPANTGKTQAQVEAALRAAGHN
jgi:hypothetical protein